MILAFFSELESACKDHVLKASKKHFCKELFTAWKGTFATLTPVKLKLNYISVLKMILGLMYHKAFRLSINTKIFLNLV